jgi:hypothetical protein
LLFLEGLLRRERGDLAGAELVLLQLLRTSPRRQFAAIDAGLRGHKARHLLGEVYRDQGRLTESEAQWRAAVAERPDFLPAWLALGECAVERGDAGAVDDVARTLEALPGGEAQATALRGRPLPKRSE